MALMPLRRDEATAFFLDGTARGEFLLIEDLQTGELLDPRTDTAHDRARFGTVAASGGARVVSWSVPHTRRPDGSVHRSVVGIVELDEGPWWWTELRGFDPDDDLEGARVRVGFEPSGSGPDDEVLPFFEKNA
ncbi:MULTISPECIES: Zn-ribbon domain-containing OB-fold protein [unclassified Microbacterium]|uniref:Zn-ribbon domain-containing OB-fold protein n=1 Tax=unclassified Microbacterium TaxID=2609290 RepID=UPI0016051754|nr:MULTISPECIES: OB-fold domain-containing protein [unclassified Microbacterium]QNA91848.1 OB-fold domain-containing protein [Microbacterium sp. Se63.02b]QYM65068.1 OB-fold domain-containing protein [Microbacterium sp. Se5.02b]